MSELAFNINGEPFSVPPQATAWRVRRFKPKGAPEVVYGRDGTPLVLPVDAGVDDLRSEVRSEGRYRLDALNEHSQAIESAPPAYVYVHAQECSAPPPRNAAAAPAEAAAGSPSAALIQAMQINADLARSIVDRFPSMLESAAALIRAADGAGMPARPVRPFEIVAANDDDEDDDDGAPSVPAPAPAKPDGFGGFLSRLCDAVAPDLVRAVLSGRIAVPGGIGALLEPKPAAALPSVDGTHAHAVEPAPGRRVPAPVRAPHASRPAPRSTTGGDIAARTPSVATASPSGEVAAPAHTADPLAPELPTLDGADMMHFAAVLQALTQREQHYARALASELSPADLRAWVAELKMLSVDDAVTRIRAVLGALEEATTSAAPAAPQDGGAA